MRNLDVQNLEEGIALSRDFTKQQHRNSFAMVASAALAYCLTALVLPEPKALAPAVAAATCVTVGVLCAPNAYRSRNGSLVLASSLLAAMWTVPMIAVLIAFVG